MASEESAPTGKERIAKRIARAGLCSRREAEKWIAEGRVRVDGKKITSPALDVTSDTEILVDGKPLAAPEPTRLWLYHKPRGLVTSHKDEEGKRTVIESLPPGLPKHVITVGRLDKNSEGLLLLTNNGELARYLELPATGWARRYRVRVFGTPAPEALEKLKKGITVEGVRYKGLAAEIEREGTNTWLSVTLTEGKNREIRRIFEHLGHPASRLIRVSFGAFQLGNLPPGQVKEATRKIIREQLGNQWING